MLHSFAYDCLHEVAAYSRNMQQEGLYGLGEGTCVYVYSVMVEQKVSVQDHKLCTLLFEDTQIMASGKDRELHEQILEASEERAGVLTLERSAGYITAFQCFVSFNVSSYSESLIYEFSA